MTVDKNIIYNGVIRPAHSKKGLHCIRLTEEINAYICWHIEENLESEEMETK